MLYKIQTIYHFYHGIFKILIVSQNYVSTHLQRQRTYRKKKKPRENSYFVPRKSALENPKSVRKEERKKKIGEKKRER